MKNSRREFIKKSAMSSAGLYFGALGFSAQSYRKIIGANDRVRVGVVGFSDRHRSSHVPSFMNHYKELNFDVVGVSDIWKKRREEGSALWKEKMQHDVVAYRNNEEMYNSKTVDAVFMSDCRFSEASTAHLLRRCRAGCVMYMREKPLQKVRWKTVAPH